MYSFLEGLACTRCDESVDDAKAVRLECPACGGFLEARYHLDAARREVDRDGLFRAGRGMWRLAPLLPVRSPEHVVTLMEGDTPLLPLRRWGAKRGLSRVYAKDETRNPTGSFKDRGAAVTASKCRELGVDTLLISSSGNASAALSAYTAVAGQTLYALIRTQTSLVLATQNAIYGARTIRIRGTNRDANALAARLCRERGWFDGMTPRNLYRVEGKKTIAYEIAQQMGWQSPRWILLPTGGGTNALAVCKAFDEMQRLGWVSGLPSPVVIQPEGCAPIVRAFKEKAPVRPWERAETFAEGIAVLAPAGGDAVVEALNSSGGLAEAVSDGEIAEAMRDLASLEGLFVQPASAASLAGLARLARMGVVGPDDPAVCILTGTGKNAADIAATVAGDIPTIDPTLEEFACLEVRSRWEKM